MIYFPPVGAAASRERNDHPDRVIGIIGRDSL